MSDTDQLLRLQSTEYANPGPQSHSCSSATVQSTYPLNGVNFDGLSTHCTQPDNAAQQPFSTDRHETAVHSADSQKLLQHNEELTEPLDHSAMFSSPSASISMQPHGSINLCDQSPRLEKMWDDMAGTFEDIGAPPAMLPSNSELSFQVQLPDGNSQQVPLTEPFPEYSAAVPRQRRERKPHLSEMLQKEIDEITKNGFRALSPEEIARVGAMQTELDNQKAKVCQLFYFPIL